MRALIIKVVLSSEGPYGFHFSVYVRTHCSKEREIWGACAVDWRIAMLCTWVQRAGFSDFFIAPRITSLQVHTQNSALHGAATYYSYAPLIFVCKTEKKKLNNELCHLLGGGKHLCIMHNFFRGLKYVWEQGFGINLSHSCRQMNANDFSRTILPGEQI